MAKVSFKVTQLPSACGDRLLSNAEKLADKMLNLSRVPYVDEWIDFNGVSYKVVKVKHTPIVGLQDATVEVEYCEYENGDRPI
ncbi:hypothetical protein PN498_04005 [Oscillatoria sp. CS-180]|uniref:hypothetical protein n=1 Tax=Oscillatoria sp. CS-180 TaxID=3021720 RepID=UPI00232C183D|nr:hypothetical protein [Oscillatoria sp. CS-180]MDB9525140.1 hypothetical protein [Oscillatoria sp. CS-180]